MTSTALQNHPHRVTSPAPSPNSWKPKRANSKVDRNYRKKASLILKLQRRSVSSFHIAVTNTSQEELIRQRFSGLMTSVHHDGEGIEVQLGSW